MTPNIIGKLLGAQSSVELASMRQMVTNHIVDLERVIKNKNYTEAWTEASFAHDLNLSKFILKTVNVILERRSK